MRFHCNQQKLQIQIVVNYILVTTPQCGACCRIVMHGICACFALSMYCYNLQPHHHRTNPFGLLDGERISKLDGSFERLCMCLCTPCALLVVACFIVVWLPFESQDQTRLCLVVLEPCSVAKNYGFASCSIFLSHVCSCAGNLSLSDTSAACNSARSCPSSSVPK